MIGKLKLNTYWLLLSQGITIITALTLSLILARHLGPVYNGEYGFANSIINIFAVFVDFGISSITIRDLARDLTKTKKYIDNIMLLKVLMGLILLFMIFITSIFFKNKFSGITLLMLFLGIYNILSGGFNPFLRGIFRSYSEMQYESITIIAEKIILIVLGVIALFYYKSIIFYSLALTISATMGMAVTIYIIRKRFTKFFYEIDWKFWKYILKEIWPFGLSSIMITIYFSIDQTIIGILKPIIYVGYFAIARSTTGVMTSIIGIFIGVLFPIFSSLYKSNIQELEKLIDNALKFMVIIAMVFLTEMLFLSHNLVLLVFGYKYLPSVDPLILLSCATTIIFINSLLGNVLSATDKQKAFMPGLFISMIINILVNLILVPMYGINGSAIASIFTEAFLAIYIYNLVNKEINVKIHKHLLKPLIASIVMAATIIILHSVEVLALSIIGIIVYFLTLILIKGISIKFIKEEILTLKRV